jgi:hypothetical protein
MKRYFPLFILLGCAAAFALGIAYLFELRFESGDVYPPYSSLRADPLGTMALYESFERIPGLTVSRDFSESDTLPEEPQTIYLHLGGEPFDLEGMPDEAYRNLQDFLTRGGRLVITYFPQTENFWSDEGTNSAENKKMTKQKSDKKVQDNDDNKDYHWTSLEDKWGFHIGFDALDTNGDSYAAATVYNQTDLPLPDTLAWHSGIIFTNLAHAWRVIYARGGNAVVMERKFGPGSVVMAGDSYLLSNEAMLKDRHTDLIAWLVGSAKNVVFDEAHFGIVESPGVTALMRKYRLEGLGAGLFLLAGLFVWKHSFSLVPPLADERADGFIAGKDSAAGFVNLLRRCVAPRNLLSTCFGEWKKSVTRNGKHFPARFQRAEAVFAVENTDPGRSPVETYKKITESLGTQNQKL